MMAWLLHPCRCLLRRAVLLLALVASLGAPAFAASVAGGATVTALPPCHEARDASVSGGHTSARADLHAASTPMVGHHGAGADSERAPHAGGTHALPLCCATACVIALPPPAVLPLLGAMLRPLWDNPPGLTLNGRAPGIPVPPPRVS